MSGLSKNKGYGTKQHMEGLKKYGITDFHRASFSPCKDKLKIDFIDSIKSNHSNLEYQNNKF